jgi:uncharacterized repeat protein (TIGR01451 family)
MRSRHRLCLFTVASVVILAVGMPTSALAIGPNAILPGFNSTTYGANDDGSWPCVGSGVGTPGGCTPAKITLPFSFNFFGTTYNQLYLNNNGNLTFDTPLATYTPFPIVTTSHVIIAPFFADVDTRVGNLVTFGSGTVNGRTAWGVNWPGVGCFDANNSVLDYFQVILIDRTDTGPGNFDIMFNYDQIHWDTGQASGGNNVCLGTTGSARAGYSNGTTSSFELPGSGISSALLDSNAATGLIHHTLNCNGQLGCYVFGVRVGVPQVSDLAVTKTGPANAVLGQSVTYQIVATNNGPSDATGVTVTDVLPAGATLTSATPSTGTCTGTGPVICTIGALANGSSATITVVATLNTGGTNVDTATVTGDQPDPNAANNSASVSTMVPNEQPIAAAPASISATEGQIFSGTVATFTDPNTTDATAAGYSATIDWGDGTPLDTSATIGGSAGSFTVSGIHTYAEEKPTYTVTVTITDVDMTTNTATATSTAVVSDAALTATPACPATSTIKSFNGTTATFTDAASPSGTLSDFTATINWGDGFSSPADGQPVIISGPISGVYTVTGIHTYATTGTFTITTTITDVGGSTVTTSCSTLGFTFAPGGGSFVIGDQNAAVGTSVTFWGAQWAKENSLSGGSAPRSFKGFAENPTTPSCGASWSADPGNSTPPPDGPLPTFMAVIVTSSADKSGSTISGNTVHIVIVKTDPGYDANPGHAGTGTVVAVVC